MTALWRLITREPVRTQGVVQAFVALLTAFGLQWSAEQVGAVMAFTAVLLAWVTREMVTPVKTQSDG